MHKWLKNFFACSFLVFLFADCATLPKEKSGNKQAVILISLDGFRADYIEKYHPSYLSLLAEKGVHAKWLIPSYPTKTFPNHYTIVTGLYPDNHGIFENNIWNPEDNAVFGMNNRKEVQNPQWWGGEPIWVTAEKKGITTGAFFYPGSETRIREVQPAYWKLYEHEFPNNKRVDTVLKWLDLPDSLRPQFIAMYFSDVDDVGHAYGPDAKETHAAVLSVDSLVGQLLHGLSARGILQSTNIIITSDHGMAPYKPRDAVILDKLIDTAKAKKIIWTSEFTQIFPKPSMEDELYTTLQKKLPQNVKVYKPSQFPARLNFGKNKLIAPLVVVPDEGTIIMKSARYEQYAKQGELDKTRGAHGYDNQLASMRALFIAAGPSFKTRYKAEPFENIQIYNLMCYLLGLEPAPNDGNFSQVKNLLRR